MSAERKESQPSIDDILSSIREIIADDGAETSTCDETEPQQDDTAHIQANGSGHSQSDILSVLRGGQEQQPEVQPDHEASPQSAEEVLDLSEEFIVTEASAALVDEQEQLTQPNVDATQQQEGTEVYEPEQTAEPGAGHPDDGAIAQADVWAEDFQMPVGDEGPTSPFTATQNHPESAWPRTDPFDVTESYKLARSQGMSGRLGRGMVDDDIAHPSEPSEHDTREEPEHANAAEQDHPGIRLSSLGDADEVKEEDAEDDTEEASHALHAPAEEPTSADPAPLRAFPAADELEAVFGMPPRQWSGGAQPRSEADAPAFEVAEEQPDQESDVRKPEEPHWDETAAGCVDAPRDDIQAAGAEPEPHQPRHDGSIDMTRSQSSMAETGGQSVAVDPAPQAAAAMGSKTLEDSVKELLRPMLQEWLDKNMPRLVEAAMREHVAAAQGQSADDRAPAPRRSGDSPDDDQ